MHSSTHKEKQNRFPFSSILTTILGGLRNQAYHTAFVLFENSWVSLQNKRDSWKYVKNKAMVFDVLTYGQSGTPLYFCWFQREEFAVNTRKIYSFIKDWMKAESFGAKFEETALKQGSTLSYVWSLYFHLLKGLVKFKEKCVLIVSWWIHHPNR